MNTALRAALAFSLVLVPSGASADASRSYYENKYFSVDIEKDGERCSMYTMFTHRENGQVFFSVGYNAREKRVQLSVTSTVTTSLPDEGEVDLDLIFLDNGNLKFDDGWGKVKFYYRKGDGFYVFSSFFSGTENVDQILSDISRSQTLGLMYNEKVFQGIPLTGSALPIQKLKDCSFEVAGLNKRDPFAH